MKSAGFDEKQAESVVETIDKAVNETVATKTDIALLATKMATKDDIKDMATKDDIKDMATKDDIKDMATKADLEVLRKTVEGLIAKLETRIMRMMLFQTLVVVGMLITVVAKLP